MTQQAAVFGTARLSRVADVVVSALDEMSGATSPRLQLELMIARVLTFGGASDAPATPAVSTPASPAASTPAPTPAPSPAATRVPAPVPAEPAPAPAEPGASEPSPAPLPEGPVTLETLTQAWPRVLTTLEGVRRSSWLLVMGARVAGYDDEVLTLVFSSANDVAAFKQRSATGGPSEDLRTAIQTVLGVRVKYIARNETDEGPGDGGGRPPAPAVPPQTPVASDAPPVSAPSAPAATAEPPRPVTAPSVSAVTDWAVAPIPSDPAPSAPAPSAVVVTPPAVEPPQFAVDDEPEDAEARVAVATRPDEERWFEGAPEGEVLPASVVVPSLSDDDDDEPVADVAPLPLPPVPPVSRGPERYGEAVVRQVLGATFVREEPHASATRFS